MKSKENIPEGFRISIYLNPFFATTILKKEFPKIAYRLRMIFRNYKDIVANLWHADNADVPTLILRIF
ncbi:MAG: hypothetical protein ACOVO2_01875 [Emticicia sp.]|uniref:hypothetical protein n=1 Tax=Emticicia sp. TaxID=1930953 RepID=UPI003BA74BCF